MTKVVYNDCFGGFGLSKQAMRMYCDRTGKTDVDCWDIERDDPDLVAIVEELGEEASDWASKLKITDVPAGEYWRIDEYDGSERVMTMSDYDWKLAT